MDKCPGAKEFELIGVIVNFGLGSKVLKIAKKNGVSGGTVLLGRGTVRNRILEFLALDDIRKEIVLMVAEKSIAYKALEEINIKLHFAKPNHGIAFAIPVSKIIGARPCGQNDLYANNNLPKSGGEASTMYNAIFVVVDRGNAVNVIDAAKKAGARGGTIINARGSGIHETSKLFNMEIEPEKEMVLILSDEQLTEAIVDSVRTELEIDKPGNGIIFVQGVTKTYGLY